MATKKGNSARKSPPAETRPTSPPLPKSTIWFSRGENVAWAIFFAAALAIVVLDLVLYSNAGAFWRDEACTVQISKRPTWTSMWWALGADPFPGLLVSLVRLWQIPFGGADASIRLFGTLILIGLVPAVVWACRGFRPGAPLLALALLAFNPTIFYYTGTIRAYGLAALTSVLALGAIWRLAHRPSYATGIVAFVCMLLCVQSNYHNCYVLFAIGTAAALACALAGAWKRSLFILTLCFLAGVSLAPYYIVVSRYWDSMKITQFDLDLSVLPMQFLSSLGGESSILTCVWIGTLVAACGYSAYACLASRKDRHAENSPSLHVFTLMATILLIGCGYLFLRSSKMYPNVWYFLPPIACLAVLADVSLQASEESIRWTCGRIAVSLAVVALSIAPVWQNAHIRRTNLDLVCRVVNEKAAQGDLVLVSPFWLYPGFRYYYHGSAAWNCLPMVSASELRESEDPHIAIKAIMEKPDSLQPTLDAVAQTLASGHRLWIVGGADFRQSTAPEPIPAAPNSSYGWNNNAYTALWSMHLGYYLRTHALQAQPIEVPVDQPVSHFEEMPLICIEGWRP